MEAAEIRTQALQAQAQASAQNQEAERAFKAGQADQQRQHEAQMRAVDREIEMMQLAGKENVSLAQVKAMLAGKAMDARLKTDEMRLKLSPGNPTNEGI